MKEFRNLIQVLEEMEKEEWVMGIYGMGDDLLPTTYSICNPKGDVIFETESYEGEEHLSRVMGYIAEANPKKIHLMVNLLKIYQDMFSDVLKYIDNHVHRGLSNEIMRAMNAKIDVLWREMGDGE